MKRTAIRWGFGAVLCSIMACSHARDTASQDAVTTTSEALQAVDAGNPGDGGLQGGTCSTSQSGNVATINFGTDTCALPTDRCSGPPIHLAETTNIDTAIGNTTTTIVVTYKNSGILLMRLRIEKTAPTLEKISADLGSNFVGIRHEEIVTADGKTATLVVDGRPTLPFTVGAANGTIKFVDGRPAPSLSISPDIQRAIQDTLTKAKNTVSACYAQLGSAPPATALASSFVSASSADHGHTSDTQGSFACRSCKAGCLTAGTACEYGAIVGSLVCGPFFLACALGGTALCGLAAGPVCFDACIEGGVCCPVRCGNLNSAPWPTPGCCEANEACLNQQDNLCCSPGLTTCDGISCCQQGESCLSGGVCCPAGRAICNGTKCCNDGEGCTQTGQCCPSGNLCGPNCCTGVLNKCINFGQGTCCNDAQTCGDNCCGFNDVCVVNGSDHTCCPPDRACGGVCCPTGQLCQDPSVSLCVACPTQNHTCTDNAGTSMCCPSASEACCNGACCGPDERCCSTLGTGGGLACRQRDTCNQ